jgi:hypothetical protein
MVDLLREKKTKGVEKAFEEIMAKKLAKFDEKQ